MNRQVPTVRSPATCQNVLDAPEGMVAELVGGGLHLKPRPASRHARAAWKLGARLDDPYDNGDGEVRLAPPYEAVGFALSALWS